MENQQQMDDIKTRKNWHQILSGGQIETIK
jgi:hypothetical protein